VIAALAPGTPLGEFELLARLGAGGQGTVYLACPWHADPLRRWVVRRWLRACLAAGALTAVRATRWRLAALKLAHPNATAALHDEHGHLAAPGAAHPHLACLYGRRHSGPLRDLGLAHVADHPRLYLALAYEAGAPLDRLLARRRPACPGWSLALVAQVAAALAHLHRRGIVHHDLRPANLIVRQGAAGAPHAVLIDLGAAETPAAPRRQAIYGAPSHLPPERRRAAPAPATPQVDIYGLGRLLALLTADAPRSAPLAALLADATAPNVACRAAVLPDMAALLERLRALPEAAAEPGVKRTKTVA
jgi:serine/threonine protein kinase